MTAKIITQDQLKELLTYDPVSGNFVWKINKGTRGRAGSVAGTIVCGYVSIRIDGEAYQAHRLAFLYMEGIFPPEHTDHLNRIKDDNRWNNLRMVTNQENQRNTKMRATNTSGITGVAQQKGKGAWIAEIKVSGKKIHLGAFADKKEAAKARKDAELKYKFHPNHGNGA